MKYVDSLWLVVFSDMTINKIGKSSSFSLVSSGNH